MPVVRFVQPNPVDAAASPPSKIGFGAPGGTAVDFGIGD